MFVPLCFRRGSSSVNPTEAGRERSRLYFKWWFCLVSSKSPESYDSFSHLPLCLFATILSLSFAEGILWHPEGVSRCTEECLGLKLQLLCSSLMLTASAWCCVSLNKWSALCFCMNVQDVPTESSVPVSSHFSFHLLLSHILGLNIKSRLIEYTLDTAEGRGAIKMNNNRCFVFPAYQMITDVENP